MFSRVLVAIIGIPFLVAVLLYFPPICLPIALSVLSLLAVQEALWATGAVKHKGMVGVSMLMALLIPFWYYFGAGVGVAVAGVFLFMLCLCCFAIASNQTVTFEEMGVSLYAALLLPMMLSSFVLLADLEHGKLFLLLPFVSAFASDAMALFFGMAFGKHKLAPRLSPKKTIEGSVGGFVGSVLACLVYAVIIQRVWQFQPNWSVFLLYGLLGSLLAQLGDLSFSYIKREFKIKDYGHLLAGHGGVLDRFDSVIFCAPFTYIMVMALPFLVR